MKRVALYARVSTADQNLHGQLDELRAYVARRGDQAVEFLDHGVSGAESRRPALDAMLTAARRRELSAVVVTRLDRLGRSLQHLLAILGELEELDVDFVSLEDGLDTGTSVGRLFMQIRGAFAEYERAVIRERVRSGMAAAKRRGQHLGRRRVLEGETLQRAQRLRRAGRSYREIARTLGVARSTVYDALKEVSGKAANAEPTTASKRVGIRASRNRLEVSG